MSSSGSKTLLTFFAGVIAGAAAGAIAGILFAPDKGSETRKKILSRTVNAREDLAARLESLKKTIEEKLAEKNG